MEDGGKEGMKFGKNLFALVKLLRAATLTV